MPVELNIVESVTELDTTVVEVILTSASEPVDLRVVCIHGAPVNA